MKELETGQYTIAKIDYLEATGNEAEAMILRGDCGEIQTHGNKAYIETMDLIEEGEYGEAFNYLDGGVEYEETDVF